MDPNTKFLASRATRKMSHKNEAPQNSEVKTDRAMCFFIQVYFSFFVSHLPTHWYNVAGCVSEGGREKAHVGCQEQDALGGGGGGQPPPLLCPPLGVGTPPHDLTNRKCKERF